MMNEKEYKKEKKDCAKMLGISLKEYEADLKSIIVPKLKVNEECVEYDNSILELFGAKESDLKKKK